MENELDVEQRLEVANSLEEMVENFEAKLKDLVKEGNHIAMVCRLLDGGVEREGDSMQLYLVNRLKSFIEGNEMFRFDDLKQEIKEEIAIAEEAE